MLSMSHFSAQFQRITQISKMGVIHHTFQYTEERILVTLYKCLVRLHLEFANQVWDPHLAKHIAVLEHLQQHATWMIPGLGEMVYEDRLIFISEEI